jgi:chemotaxis methyl-accepting protein methylase
MDDESFKLILKYFNLSWKGYRKVRKGVKKRLVRHMQAIGCVTVEDYILRITHDLECRKACRECLTVSISRFFRDRGLWDAIENLVLPKLIKRFGKTDCFTAWSCGCARGEEVYSFNIVWNRLRGRVIDLPDLNLIASDMNPEYLKMAKTGIYQARSLKEVPVPWVSEYFEKRKNRCQFRIRSFLKENIRWVEHDIFNDPIPLDTVHLLFLRNNLLTYHESPEKKDAFSKLVNAIRLNGCLVIGAHERLPGGDFGLVQDENFPLVYHKKNLQ